MKTKKEKQSEGMKELNQKELQTIMGGKRIVYYKESDGSWTIKTVN